MPSNLRPLDVDMLPFFPADTMVGSLAYNRIAATHSMIDFFAKKDPTCVARYFKKPYINHNMRAPDGLDPVHDLAQRAVHWDGVHTIVRRALAEGDLVLLHSVYSNLLGIPGQRVAFDLFRFDDGMIVEHWDALQNAEAPDLSGLSHVAGSVDIVDVGMEEANRAVATRFIETVLIGGDVEHAGEFIDTSAYIAHSPVRAAGLERDHGSFVPNADAPKVTYVRYHITLAEGNFVFIQGEARIGDEQVLEVYDLFRLRDGKIVEHWDVLQALAPRDQWANPNGPFGFSAA